MVKIPLGIPLPQEEDSMPKSVNHYLSDGRKYNGSTHRMPDGSIQTGARHSAKSVPLYHYTDLPEKARKKARASWRIRVS